MKPVSPCKCIPSRKKRFQRKTIEQRSVPFTCPEVAPDTNYFILERHLTLQRQLITGQTFTNWPALKSPKKDYDGEGHVWKEPEPFTSQLTVTMAVWATFHTLAEFKTGALGGPLRLNPRANRRTPLLDTKIAHLIESICPKESKWSQIFLRDSPSQSSGR